MKNILLSLTLVMSFTLILTYSVKAESPLTGIWKQVEDQGANRGKVGSHIEMYEKDGLFYGKIDKLLLDQPDKICTKCPENLKNKPLVGMVIMQNMKQTGKMDSEQGIEYAGGTILDPDSGDIYKCKMWIKDDVLTVRAFIGFSLLGRSARWYRLK